MSALTAHPLGQRKDGGRPRRRRSAPSPAAQAFIDSVPAPYGSLPTHRRFLHGQHVPRCPRRRRRR
ncbi:hypothetical protein HMPREF1979_01936 [Actinomyces johnsonii F0542]|uniref:Uncharacterized protein n=1 Tax=Actinomyces johnsonii F0542 TaxID=1321818 RepID=U1Q5G3_9ACTO|nr:hypothetical protein HMPREF1979_01936 [Actinomyces johnsonii F0542]